MNRSFLCFAALSTITTILMANCTPQLPALNEITPTETKTALESIETATEVLTEARSSEIAEQTPTSVPSQTPSPPNVLPTATLTPPATLTIFDAREKFIDLSKINGNCELPCLWGLSPGENTIRDGLEVFYPLIAASNVSYFDDKSGYVILTYPVDNRTFSLSINYRSNREDYVITSLNIRGQELEKITEGEYEEITGSPFYLSAMEKYTPTNILATHGAPDRILIGATSSCGNMEPNAPCNPFSIVFLYPEAGIFVEYLSHIEEDGPWIKGCFSKSNYELWLVPPGNSSDYLDFLSDQYLWEYYNSDFHLIFPFNTPFQKDIEVATSFSIAEFYTGFLNGEIDCLISPADIWGSY